MASAISYTKRKQHKHNAEMAMIRKAFDCINGVESILDAPCGTGRATIMLARLGYTTVGIDLGDAAINIAKQKIIEAGVLASLEKADVESLYYENQAFDAVLCFRLYHHFPNDEIRSRVISEICRVAKNYVLISYLSPISITSVRRKLKKALYGKKSKQHATSLASINALFSNHDYQLVKDIPRRRFLNTLHLAVFKRKEYDPNLTEPSNLRIIQRGK